MKLNIGGGANWNNPGWLNLDQRADQPFHLTPTCTFSLFAPHAGETVFPDGSIEMIYSSHCLEHLDDATVDRVLSECRRVLRPDGTLVLKLPDFEGVLDAYRRGDDAYFARQWNIESVVPTWKRFDISDTIEARAAMIFCGVIALKYHGPPVYPHGVYREVLSNPAFSPHDISAALRPQWTGEDKGNYNHRNAWSRAELRDLLSQHGFTVQTMDADLVTALDIPTIAEMRAISMYTLAKVKP